jgi:hypothetical protein
MNTARLAGLDVSRLILGSNPFSGFSHLGHEMDESMVHYFTTVRIKEVLFQAESLGINTFLGRGDRHIIRILTEYWDEGGTLQWIGQTCPELGAPEPVMRRMVDCGAKAVYIHGGHADHLVVNGQAEKLIPTAEFGRTLGVPVGLAGHMPPTIQWGEANLDLDFYMCCYYNPISRIADGQHKAGLREQYLPEDRDAMTDLIQTLSRPAIHYKVMAAGRNEPAEAFAFAAGKLRANDVCCVGVYPAQKPDMLAEDAALLTAALERLGK